MNKYWSTILLSLVVLIALIYTILLVGFEREGSKGQLRGVFYWFYVDDPPLSIAHFICAGILGVALLTLVVWFIAIIRRYIKRLYGWGLMFIGAISFCVLAFVALIFAIPPYSQHLDEWRQDSNLYRLAFWSTSSDDYFDILFECDSMGIICNEICSSRVDFTKISTQQPKIAVSGSPQFISIVDNGQTLCSSEAKT